MKIRLKKQDGDSWLFTAETKRNKQRVRKYAKVTAKHMSREAMAEGVHACTERLASHLGSENPYAGIRGDTQ